MNLRKVFLASLVICTLFSFSVSAQTNAVNKSVEDLRESLKKNSRIQFQDLTIYFHPLEFDTCEVSYQYKLAENIGSGLTSSGNSSSPLSTYEQTRLKGAVLQQTISGNYINLPGRRNEIANLMNVNATSTSTVVTSFDLREIDADSLKIEKRPSGIFLFFQTDKRSKAIEKDSFSTDAIPEKNKEYLPVIAPRKGEYLPVTSAKKAEKVKELFSQAISQCKSN